MTRRVPKRGFTNEGNKQIYTAINLERLKDFDANSVVDLQALKDKGIIKKRCECVKILSRGEISVPLTVKVDMISASAKEKIVAAGGKIEEL